MCFAIHRAPALEALVIGFQFPFRRDVLCNSVPGPKRWLLRRSFQFPFRRDVLCNHPKTAAACYLLQLFQFPFRRDVLCNSGLPRRMVYAEGVSIPFSSGCALQFVVQCTTADRVIGFQFPFRRDVLCNSRILVSTLLKPPSFQFPFRRDVLCNHLTSAHQREIR